MSTLMQDVRYATRLLVKQPAFTAVIIVSLALGIGANTMIFSVVNAVMLRALPFPAADRVVILWSTPPNRPEGRSAANPGNCFDLVEKDTVFEHVGCFRPFVEGVFYEDGTNAEGAEDMQGELFSYGVLQTIGVQPSIGRWFTDKEDEEASERVALISYRLWQRRFGGSSDVLGKKVRLSDGRNSGLLSTVIGVMPAGFSFSNPNADYWIPARVPRISRNSPGRSDIAVARLKSGTTIEQAQAAMNARAVAFAEENPKLNKGWGIRVEPFRQALITPVKQPLALLQGAVGLVLLIACANVACLLLAQGASRHKELTVRVALGSTRWRIVRQLLTQSILLSLAGGLLGLIFAWVGVRLVVNSLPQFMGFARITLASIDPSVMVFTLVISVASGILFGILPALQVSRPDLMDALKESSRGSTAGAARQRLRAIFVVAQIAIALVLLIGAGLMINSFLRLYTVQVGFNPHNITTFQISFAAEQFRRYTGNVTPSGSIEFELSPRVGVLSEQIRQRVASVRGVQFVTAVGTTPPGAGYSRGFGFTIDGQQTAVSEKDAFTAEWFPVMGDYFKTIGVPVLRGRDFTLQDTFTAAPVVLINSTMAQRFFPNQDPIGRQLQITYFNDKPREIVGVVGDVRQNSRELKPEAQMYVPYPQLPVLTAANNAVGLENVVFLMRLSGSPSNQLMSALRSAIGEVNTAQAQASVNFKPLEQYMSDQLQGFPQYVLLLAIFAGIALVLAIVGIYGMMAHSVSQRTGEISIRMALGATPSNVLTVILRRGLILIGAGLVIGLGASLALTKIMRSFLWGVTPTDSLTFAVVLVVLAAIGLFACYIPARKAARTDPVIALKYE
jgi:putative ABC transport system permease protein